MLDQADTTPVAMDSVRVCDDAKAQVSQSAWSDVKESMRSLTKSTKSEALSDVLDFSRSIYPSDHRSDNVLSVPTVKPENAEKGADATAKAGDATAKPADATGKPADSVPIEAYRGEKISKDVEPANHTVAKGETLTKIAREHLGPDASDQDVQQHINEIAKLNKISNPNLILEGQQLKLPGHTADGGMVTVDEQGNKKTVWQDGTRRTNNKDGSGEVFRPDGSEHHWGRKPTDNYDVKITDDGGVEKTDHNGNKTTKWDNGVVKQENKDGTGYDRQPQTGGGYAEHHWGSKQEDNYDVLKKADGSYKIADGKGDHEGREAKTDAEKIALDRTRLNESVENMKDPAAKERFQKDMADFEDRAKKQNLPPEEVAKTYKEISKLMESKGSEPIDEPARARVAEQVMNHAAHPESVNQGAHGTCNTATVESRTYSRTPSEAAAMVTEVSTTGKYTTKSGMVIPVDKGSLQADMEERAANHPADGTSRRDQASRIFQVTAVNVAYEKQNQSTTPKGQLRYEQNASAGSGDTGERVWDYSTTPRSAARDGSGNLIAPPAVCNKDIRDISNEITGKNEKDVVLISDRYTSDGVTPQVTSEKDLNDKLAKLKEDGKLPVIIYLDARNEPYQTDGGFGAAGGSGRAHVITITDYDAKTGQAQIDNQWGPKGDHAISCHDLYQSMMPAGDPVQMEAMKKDIDYDRKNNKVDGFKEFETLRLQAMNGTLTGQPFDDAVVKTMKDQQTRWAKGETYPGERARAEKHYNDILNRLPKAEADKIRAAVAAP